MLFAGRHGSLCKHFIWVKTGPLNLQSTIFWSIWCLVGAHNLSCMGSTIVMEERSLRQNTWDYNEVHVHFRFIIMQFLTFNENYTVSDLKEVMKHMWKLHRRLVVIARLWAFCSILCNPAAKILVPNWFIFGYLVLSRRSLKSRLQDKFHVHEQINKLRLCYKPQPDGSWNTLTLFVF